MLTRIKKIITPLIACAMLLVSFGVFLQSAHADVTPTPSIVGSESPTPSPTPNQNSSIGECSSKNLSAADCVTYYQNKLSDTQGQEHTLSSQIAVMNSQINLTKARIASTQNQIIQLTGEIVTTSTKIATIEQSLSGLTKVLIDHIVATYKVGVSQDFGILLSSATISDFFQRENYLRVVQAHDKQLIYDTVQAKNDYANQQNILEIKKKQVEALQAQLQDYTNQLNQEKVSEQTLLAQTQGNEAIYQRLLQAAQAQLAGFSSFASSQGGATLLSGQTSCDDWGCYYNQRDAQWGAMALNHTQYSVASDGCLMTSVAMVFTHYGHKDVTPVSININPDNFASYYPAYLLYTVVANGVSSQRNGTTISAIDNVLNNSNHDPVIVGIRYSSGDTHFVVLISGSNGSYQMNDPFVPNGHNISFTSHYSLSSIFEVDKVSM